LDDKACKGHTEDGGDMDNGTFAFSALRLDAGAKVQFIF